MPAFLNFSSFVFSVQAQEYAALFLNSRTGLQIRHFDERFDHSVLLSSLDKGPIGLDLLDFVYAERCPVLTSAAFLWQLVLEHFRTKRNNAQEIDVIGI